MFASPLRQLKPDSRLFEPLVRWLRDARWHARAQSGRHALWCSQLSMILAAMSKEKKSVHPFACLILFALFATCDAAAYLTARD
jgi:hypothetical protein